jgi:hypothetical protein
MCITGKQSKVIKDALDYLINPGGHHRCEVVVDAEYLKIYPPVNHSNVTDGAAMVRFLKRMHDAGIVSTCTKALWVGLERGRFVFWAKR